MQGRSIHDEWQRNSLGDTLSSLPKSGAKLLNTVMGNECGFQAWISWASEWINTGCSRAAIKALNLGGGRAGGGRESTMTVFAIKKPLIKQILPINQRKTFLRALSASLCERSNKGYSHINHLPELRFKSTLYPRAPVLLISSCSFKQGDLIWIKLPL